MRSTGQPYSQVCGMLYGTQTCDCQPPEKRAKCGRDKQERGRRARANWHGHNRSLLGYYAKEEADWCTVYTFCVAWVASPWSLLSAISFVCYFTIFFCNVSLSFCAVHLPELLEKAKTPPEHLAVLSSRIVEFLE